MDTIELKIFKMLAVHLRQEKGLVWAMFIMVINYYLCWFVKQW